MKSMMTPLCTHVLGLTLVLAPATVAPSVATTLRSSASCTTEIVTLRGYGDPRLESMRAGHVGAPAPLSAGERAELATAQLNSPSLAELRGGDLTEKEWTWIAIGAVILLLIVLI
jgi:hypothetical protein